MTKDGQNSMTGKRTATERHMVVPTLSAIMVLVAGCQSSGPGSFAYKTDKRALKAMEQVALAARECWFRSDDKDFRPYRMSPELNSFSGRPRILVVSKRDPNGRPLAVIEAHGDPATVDAYGPLLEQPVGNRIKSDIQRWTGDSSSCA